MSSTRFHLPATRPNAHIFSHARPYKRDTFSDSSTSPASHHRPCSHPYPTPLHRTRSHAFPPNYDPTSTRLSHLTPTTTLTHPPDQPPTPFLPLLPSPRPPPLAHAAYRAHDMVTFDTVNYLSSRLVRFTVISVCLWSATVRPSFSLSFPLFSYPLSLCISPSRFALSFPLDSFAFLSFSFPKLLVFQFPFPP